MKKCPHCGMNIRDNVEVCGYCGGEIAPQRAAAPAMKGSQGTQRNPPPRQAQKRPVPPPADEPENAEGEEEEGGLSKILQPGEQVLIGSLNVSVKKFFFHAYLTNKRIFLIDTQEKKLKVTAKDIPRETIADSIVEYSENADPVLVLSVKSAADDEVKTMKLVFSQNGTDRTGEIDDWIALLGREPEEKAPRRQAPAQKEPEPEEVVPEEEPEEERLPPRPVKAAARPEELHPARKPLKEHERQPPVKRLIPMAREMEPEPEPPQVVPQPPQRRVQVKTVEEPQQHRVPVVRSVPTTVRGETQPVRKPEVHAAVRTAMNAPVQPMRQTQISPVKATTAEPVRRPLPEVPRQVVPEERPVVRKVVAPEEPADSPQFCHNCGKKLPGEANFCPGCGTRLGRSRTDPSARASKTIPRPAAATTPPPAPQRRIPRIEEIHEDEEEVEEQPRRPPVKKTPKGSDMTILQKFLRR